MLQRGGVAIRVRRAPLAAQGIGKRSMYAGKKGTNEEEEQETEKK